MNIICNVCPRDIRFATPDDRIGTLLMAEHFRDQHGDAKPLNRIRAWRARDLETARLEAEAGV